MGNDELKDRIRTSILKFEQKQWDEINPRKKDGTTKKRNKNKRPEAEIVKAIKRWLKSNGFSVNTVEAKATFDPGTGRYLTGQVERGFSDILACDPRGFACYIEVKAPGKRAALAEHQREFLIDKIDHNAFAGVFDSADDLADAHAQFTDIRRGGKSAKAYLLGLLPKLRSATDEKPLFD